jgi:hypothetical protein
LLLHFVQADAFLGHAAQARARCDAQGLYLRPTQDFSQPWTAEKLYAKYGLTDEEIAFVEWMIRPMEITGDLFVEDTVDGGDDE